jgi:cyclopropane-fatty-acyl-phospholipid synthase
LTSTQLSAPTGRARDTPHSGARALCNALSGLRAGHLEICAPGGERYTFAGALPGPSAHVELYRWAAADELLALNQGCVRAYLSDGWDSADLVDLLTLAELNYDAFCPETRVRRWDRLARLAHRMRINVHARYRLGNEFYRQWLDPSLNYSAALFDGDLARSLDDAQTTKFERILHALRPRPGQTLLDIGCGWGGFAWHAAAHYGCRVHAVTISRRQVQWARERIEQAGLQQTVNVELRDFRELHDRYDYVVSIEAYEVMGEALWPAYFDTIARCLDGAGTAFLQAGVVADSLFERCRKQPNFIRRHIHPTAQLAAWPMLEVRAQRAGLMVRSSAVSSADYAQTLKCWRQRFNDDWPQLAQLGLDRRFQRLWNFYLAYCEAGYRAGRTALVQAQIEHRTA